MPGHRRDCFTRSKNPGRVCQKPATASIRERQGLYRQPKGVRVSRHPPDLPLSKRAQARLQRPPRRDSVTHKATTCMVDGGRDDEYVPERIAEIEREIREVAAVLYSHEFGVFTP